MSGGRATVGFRRGDKLSRQAGDISSISPEGHALTSLFLVECKHYRKLDIEAFFLTGKGRLSRFWEKAVAEARQHGLEPLLIARQNFTPDIIVTRPRALSQFKELNDSMVVKLARPGKTPCEVRLLKQLLELEFCVKN